MTVYHATMLKAFVSRLSTVALMVLAGYLCFAQTNEPEWAKAFVLLFLAFVIGGQIYKLIGYLAMDRDEFLKQWEWEISQ